MAETYLSGVHSEEGRRALAEVVLALFRRWGIDEEQQAALLGMAEVGALWKGGALPNTMSVLERAGLLLAIDRMLKMLFADEPLMQDTWVEFPNGALEGCSPLKVMLEGEEGLRRVHGLLTRQTSA
jgi:hypothetical protein